MKAIALKRVLLAASLLVPAACADRTADCTPTGQREASAGAARCAADAAAREVALDHKLDAGPVLSVAPPQRRKARPAVHAQPESPESMESLASGLPGESY
ncbi:hypothetical protein [Azospirillum isscasi]|uniref:Lipoprotein n=1 Tax=Azospirillum isscasi TaxID=3053926 RepID=A0ABU0WDF6_9PROT|nr:hypothetical protein [Azospirillum isscasi]MDQ2102228.1 hypothetical protein [Azospirillum isscasi]